MTAELPVLTPEAAYALWAASYPPYAHNVLMQTEERAMLALLPGDLTGCTVLDAGCGSGRYIAHARLRGAQQTVGLDLSKAMLQRAQGEVQLASGPQSGIGLACARVEQLPLRANCADVVICGLTLGHLPELTFALSELHRVTKPGGLVLCSDFHPIGETFGWKRDFKAGGRRYAVQHTAHSLEAWHTACRTVGLQIAALQEVHLDPADIPPGAKFDPAGLAAPIALVLALHPVE